MDIVTSSYYVINLPSWDLTSMRTTLSLSLCGDLKSVLNSNTDCPYHMFLLCHHHVLVASRNRENHSFNMPTPCTYHLSSSLIMPSIHYIQSSGNQLTDNIKNVIILKTYMMHVLLHIVLTNFQSTATYTRD